MYVCMEVSGRIEEVVGGVSVEAVEERLGSLVGERAKDDVGGGGSETLSTH